MGYKIEDTPLAEQDLDGILSYIAENLGNRAAAVSFLDEVDACYINLQQMPFMYEQCRDPQLRALGYRKAIIKNYVMIYRVDEDKKIVYILRFFYGRRDYEKLI